MKAISFLRECRAELQKVQWPSREEVVSSTIVVLITVIIFSLFLFFSDMLFVEVLTFLWEKAG